MARIRATRRIEWDAAHRVLRHESKCSTLHGHRYAAEITVSASQLDEVGRVVDFGVLKDLIGGWIDKMWDHTTLVNYEDEALKSFCEGELSKGKKPPFYFDCEPTAENIAKLLGERSQGMLSELASSLRVESVRVYETPNCWADWTAA